MKTLILSDIFNGTGNSIIPYSLKWARNTETRAEVLHIIDERETQGVYSPYSDSQSVASDVEMHVETLKKEKITIGDKLKVYLSKQLSLINYPLKLDYSVRIGNFEKVLKSQLNADDTLILNCSDYVSYFESFTNMMKVIKSLPCQVLCIPGKYEFKTPAKTLFAISEEDEGDYDKREHINNLLYNLQSYPKVISSYYAYSHEVEEKPYNSGDYELVYTIVPNDTIGIKSKNNIESLIQTLKIDLLTMCKNKNITKKSNMIFRLLENKTLPILFIQ